VPIRSQVGQPLPDDRLLPGVATVDVQRVALQRWR
jgi:hypothetical protein